MSEIVSGFRKTHSLYILEMTTSEPPNTYAMEYGTFNSFRQSDIHIETSKGEIETLINVLIDIK